MENYQQTEVYVYLRSQLDYLKGDLEVFHKICDEAEKKEFQTNSDPVTSLAGDPIPLSPSVTVQTTQNPADGQKVYRMTIPMTLALFAAVDSIGYLLADHTRSIATNENFLAFFNILDSRPAQKHIELLNFIFRQGLSHLYFPKLNMGISYHRSNPEPLINKNADGMLILNVVTLEKLVLEVFGQVIQNSALYPKMQQRYQILIDKYEGQDRQKITEFEQQ